VRREGGKLTAGKMSAKRATLASVEPHIHSAIEDKPVVEEGSYRRVNIFIPHYFTKRTEGKVM